MRNLAKFLGGIVLLLAAVSCWAGPFGFEYGMSRADIVKAVGKDAVLKEDGDVMMLSTAPKPHPDFSVYMVMVSPDKGLLKIVALTPMIATNVFGEALHAKYDGVQKSLTEVYGTGKSADLVREGSLWTDPQDFMMGLMKEDRVLETVWLFQQPKNHIVGMVLEATARSTEEGRLTLSYEFEGFSDYMKAKKDKQNSVY